MNLSAVTLVLSLGLASCIPFQTATDDKIKERIENSNQQMTQQKIETDINKLGKIISLPYQPQSVVWKTGKMGTADDSIPGPSDYEVDAVLEFSKADADKIQSAAEKQTETKKDGIFWQDWFPASLRSRARADGSRKVLDGLSLSPEMFAKSPYLNGVLIRIEGTNTFFVSLRTS